MTIVVVGIVFFLAFTRAGKNLTKRLLDSKKYVICHLKRPSTDFDEVHYIIPSPDYLTVVGKFDYNLNPQYAMMKWKGRLHFHLNEGDSIPDYLHRKDSKEEILCQVQEIKTALHNKSYSFFYGKSTNVAMIIAIVACAISILVAIYGIYEIQKISPLITWLYENPPQVANVIVPEVVGK